jgi:hypothetical protein
MLINSRLLPIMMTLSLAACGSSSETSKPSLTPSNILPGAEELERIKEDEAYQKEYKAIESRVYHHLLGDDFKEDPPSTLYPYYGTITPATHDLIKRLWTTLASKGFSGYDPSVLTPTTVYHFADIQTLHRSPAFYEAPFHIKLIYKLMSTNWYSLTQLPKAFHLFKFSDMLMGLKFNGQYVYQFFNGPKLNIKLPLQPSKNFDSLAFNLSAEKPDWTDLHPGTIVSNEQAVEWNQTIIDALKADPFFKQFFEAAALSDGSGTVSLSGARKGSTGIDAVALNVNGISGSHVELGLPLYVQLKGSVDHGKSTNLTTGTVAYKLGNTVVGAIQSYANSGTGFGSEGRQLETSVVASHSFGSFFIEGQLGSVSATDVRFKDWSGVRSQVTLGVDTQWVSPFVQLTHRDFGDRTDTATYAGFQMDISELNADTYAFSTHLFTKIGHHSVHGLTGALEWSGSLTLTSGVSFTTNLSLGTMAEPSAGLTFTLDR